MNVRNGRFLIVCLVAVVVSSMIPLSSVFAASDCKGLEKGQCESKSACTWVNGYTRKDGVKVSSHCKSIGKKGGSSGSKDKKSNSDKDKKSSSEKKS